LFAISAFVLAATSFEKMQCYHRSVSKKYYKERDLYRSHLELIPEITYSSARRYRVMSVNLEAAVMENINELKSVISEKTLEVAELEKELKRYESVLDLLRDDHNRNERRKGRPRGKTDLAEVLGGLPETFTSKEFIKAATRTKKPSVYLRLALSRWAKEGRVKRLERGKYQKVRNGSSHRLAA
jgi:hypothetical protein